jgi:hypothetical protein
VRRQLGEQVVAFVADQVTNGVNILMVIEGKLPDLLLVEMFIPQNLNEASPELFLVAQVSDFGEVKVFRLGQEVLFFHEFEDLVWSADLEQVLERFDFENGLVLDNVELVGFALGSHFVLNGDA